MGPSEDREADEDDHSHGYTPIGMEARYQRCDTESWQ
jgi:hypothetical protein